MVERYGFDDDGITWGPNTGGAFVSVHDYDALAARLAEIEKVVVACHQEIYSRDARLAEAGRWAKRATAACNGVVNLTELQFALSELRRVLRTADSARMILRGIVTMSDSSEATVNRTADSASAAPEVKP